MFVFVCVCVCVCVCVYVSVSFSLYSCVCVYREKVGGRQKKGNRLCFFPRERVCVHERVCMLACCVCLFVWTVVRKRGGEAVT